jgi:hypothetical protein
MKRNLLLFTISLLFLFSSGVFAQSPPHPNGGGGPGSGNTPVGGGASIGGGLLILLSLGVGYGAKKIYEMRKEGLEEAN